MHLPLLPRVHKENQRNFSANFKNRKKELNRREMSKCSLIPRKEHKTHTIHKKEEKQQETMEEYNNIAEYHVQCEMFNGQGEIKMVDRYLHLNEGVYDTLELLQREVNDIAMEVSLKAQRRAGSPPFLTLSTTRRGNIDPDKVLHCLSTEGLADYDLVQQIDSEINENNNARLQYFVFFNMFEGKSNNGQIIRIPKPKVLKMGVTIKELEMILFIMEGKDTEALNYLFPYISNDTMQEIVDRLQVAQNAITDKVRSRVFGRYIDECVRKNYHRLVNDYDTLREPVDEY